MKKILTKEFLTKLLLFFVAIQPILDFYLFFDQRLINILGISISTIIRYIFVLVLGLLFLIIIKSKKQYLFYSLYAALVIIYVFVHHYFCTNFTTLFPNDFNYLLTQEISYIIRMIIPLIIIAITSNLKINDYRFNKIIDILTISISGTIVITNIFKISMGAYITRLINYNIFDWFNNIHDTYTFYDTATRGYFTFANLISALLFGLTVFVIYRLFKEFKLKNIILIFIQMLAMFMLGTKVATFGFLLASVATIIIALFFTFIKKEIKPSPKPFLYLILITTLWFIIYPYSPCYNRINGIPQEEIPQEQEEENQKELEELLIYLNTLPEDEKKQMASNFVLDKYEDFSIREDFVTKRYSYEHDPYHWLDMFDEKIELRRDNRFLTESILIRLKENNTNNKKAIELFGISYTRMSNIFNLEKDFLSQYYTLGIVGLILFLSIYIIIILISSIYILIHKEKFTFKNVCIILAVLLGVIGAYYCGNTMDGLTFMIIYAFFFGYLINQIFIKDDKKLDDKKITIMALHLGVGGVEKYISSLCKMLENNYKIEIISSYKVSEKPGFYFSDKIKIKYLLNDRPYKKEFINAVKNLKLIDIIKYGYKNFKILILKHIKEIKAINNINSKYVITTLFHSKKVNDILNDNYIKIATEHNYHNNNKKYINKVINSCPNFNYLICVSEDLKKFYQDKFTKCKVLFIPNTIDKIPDIISNKKSNNLISVGRLVKEKGFDDLIDVVNIIKEKGIDIFLNIIGDGDEKIFLENKIKELNLTKNIKLLGSKDHDTVNKLMQEANIYVMTSHTESFGLVLIEAMSNHLACIAFDSANGAKTLLKNGTGILIKNRDKIKMANSIISLLNDKEQLNKIEEKAFEYSKQYLIDNVKEKWLTLLNKE